MYFNSLIILCYNIFGDNMKCPKCNAEYKTNLKFCPKCGEVFESNDIQMFSDIYNLELLEMYYPNKEEKIYTKKINYKYLLFGYVYAIYKRMYKHAAISIILFALGLLILYYFKLMVVYSLGFLFYFIFFIMISPIVFYIYNVFNFDRLLLLYRKQRINKIISKNRDKSKEEIEKIIIKDSVNDKSGAVITGVISTVILIIYICLFIRRFL